MDIISIIKKFRAVNFVFNFYVAAIFMVLLSCDSKKLYFMKNTALLLFVILLSINLVSQPFLHTKGKEIVTADGKPFVIKGTNLGNWLVPEGYMFHYKKATSPRLINEANRTYRA
jgi:hypothetical protein